MLMCNRILVGLKVINIQSTSTITSTTLDTLQDKQMLDYTHVPGLEENGKMTESQLNIAVAFVTYLISLGVLALVPQGVPPCECVPPFLICQNRTTIPVEVNYRHT
jgi:hypothetical protein